MAVLNYPPQGHLDTPLSTVGLQQAAAVAGHLAQQPFSLAISSDLQRAAQTGEAIVAANSSLASLARWPVARERCFGEFEGQPAEALIGAVSGRRGEELANWGPKGGETGRQFRARVKQFAAQLCEAVAGLEVDKPVVLVTTHGGFIKEFNALLVEEQGCLMPGKKGESGRICPNTGVSRYLLHLGGEGGLARAECTMLHYREHLGGLEGPEPVLYGV